MSEPPLTITPDTDLAEKLRKDFSSTHCVEELLRAVTEMSAAIGVSVSWEVLGVNDMDVDKDKLTKALGKMATASGAMLTGGKVNPIAILEAQDPMRILRERQKK